MATSPRGCLQRNDWVCGDYLTSRSDLLLSSTVQHVWLTVVSVAVGLLLALPLGLLAFRSPRVRGLVLGAATAVYTIPSLAMFSLLLPFTGLSPATVVVGLVLYSLTILVRNVLAGLQAVPAEVVESATGTGYGPASLLLRVQLPLALPALLGGLRIASVTLVSAATVAAYISAGGLGTLILTGLDQGHTEKILVGAGLVTLLALLIDWGLGAVQRRLPASG